MDRLPSRTTSPTRNRIFSFVLIAGLLGASAAIPAATAHSCTAEEGDANEQDCRGSCREGESHSHKVTHHHENGAGEDVNHIHFDCSSGQANDGGPCITPTVLGMCVIGKAERALKQALELA